MFLLKRVFGNLVPRLRLTSLRCFSADASKMLELNGKLQSELERRKNVLYEMAQKEYASRDLSKINDEINGIMSDFPPCMHAFNIVLKTYILINDTEGIRKTIEQINQNGLKPNTITYSLLISYYRNHRKMDDAVAVYERMKAAGVHPNGSIFTTLIAGFASQGNFSMAEAYFTESQQSTWVRSDLHLLNTMISCYLTAGRPEEARKLAARMAEEGLKPNHVTYKVFLAELLENKHTEEAAKLYALHLKDAPGMRSHDHGDVATRFFKAGDTHRGLEIFEACLKKHGTTAAIAFPFAIDHYSYKGQDQKVEGLMELCWTNRTILAHSCHPLLRHYLRRIEAGKAPTEALEKIKVVMEAALKADLKLSPKLELKCRELLS